jgi:hypothetical protein
MVSCFATVEPRCSVFTGWLSLFLQSYAYSFKYIVLGEAGTPDVCM